MKLATHRISLLPYFKQVFTYILNTTIKEKEGNDLVFRVRVVASSDYDDAVEEMREIIYDEKLNREIAEHNFAIGKREFSYAVLQQKLESLISPK